MLKLCLLSLNVNEPSNLFLFKKKPYYQFLTFVNVKIAQKQTLIAFLLHWQYVALKVFSINFVTTLHINVWCDGTSSSLIPPKSSFYGIITELKNLEWLNRIIGRQNLYFLMPHALLFGKFVQHPRRVISLQNS